jgi:hypothetical protein
MEPGNTAVEEGAAAQSLHIVVGQSAARTATSDRGTTIKPLSGKEENAIGRKPEPTVALGVQRNTSGFEAYKRLQENDETPPPICTKRCGKRNAANVSEKKPEDSQLEISIVPMASQVKISPIEDASPFDDLPYSPAELSCAAPRGARNAGQNTGNKRQLQHPVPGPPSKRVKNCKLDMQMAACNTANKATVSGSNQRPTTRSLSNTKQGPHGNDSKAEGTPLAWTSQEESPSPGSEPRNLSQPKGSFKLPLPARNPPKSVTRAHARSEKSDGQRASTQARQHPNVDKGPSEPRSPNVVDNPQDPCHELPIFNATKTLVALTQSAGNQSLGQPSDEVLLAAGRMLHHMMTGGTGPNYDAARSGYGLFGVFI